MALKPPLNLWMSSIGFWLGWDEMWGRDHPFLLSHLSLQQILWLESWLSDSATFCFPFSGPSGSSISNRKGRQLGRAELWLISFLTMLCHWVLLWWGQSPSSYGHGVSDLPGDLLPGFQLRSGPGSLCPNYSLQPVRISAQGESKTLTVIFLPLFLFSLPSTHTIFNSLGL